MSFLTRVEGDEQFRRMMRVVAAEKGITVSQLVRSALETAHRQEFENARVFFNAAAYNNTQSGTKGRKKAGAK